MHRNEWDLPQPLGVDPVRGPRLWRWVVALVILLGAGVAAFRVPLPPFYAFLPGPIKDVGPLIEVRGAETYSSEGSLLLTTVSVDDEVTFVDWVKDSLDPNALIVRREAFTGGGSFEQLQQEQLAEMEASKRHAQEVALAALGLAAPKADGSKVESVARGSPAAEVLREGDVIVAVDGEAVHTSCEVAKVIAAREPGDPVRITVKRGQSRRTFEMEAVADGTDPSSAVIGVLLSDVNYQFDPGLEVTIETGEIAGPSAGLLFSLGLYDKLTPEDLTHGKKIAGTGGIACDGHVQPIGGIEQKIAAAESEGAEVFLAPAGNFAAAEDAAEDIDVISVATFDDAVDYLEDLE